jgi:energy-coupling factor transporter ATP-binding protein EcfA2
MHIRRVVIEGIRRFGSGAQGLDLALPPRGWIVVAGRNGAGKTTLLQVMALGLANSFGHDYADTMFTWCRQGVKKASSRLTIVPTDEDELRRDKEILSTKAADEELIVGDHWEPTSGVMSHGRESDGNRAFAGPWHNDPKGWFAVAYGVHRRLLGQSVATDGWSSSTSRESAFLTLFRDDGSLVHPIRWLMDLDHRKLDPHAKTAERNEAKRIVEGVISLLNDDLLDDTEVLGVDSYGLSVRQDGQKLSIRNLGAGAQVLLAIVVDMLRHMHARFGTLHFGRRDHRPIVKHGGVVLIDEVEAHLHPSWQRRVGVWFMEHFPEVQFIVSTHSPFVCQAASEDGLVLLPAHGSTERARIADLDLYRRVTNGSVDDALMSDLFGLEHTWSEDAETKRARLAEVEAKVLTGKAKPAERREYDKLREELPQTMSDEVDRVARRLEPAAPASKH